MIAASSSHLRPVTRGESLQRFWISVPALLLICAAVVFVTKSDTTVFLAVHKALAHVPAALWQNATLLGDGLAIAALATLWLRSRPQIVWAALVAAVPAALISRGLKALFHVPRPPAVLREAVVVIGPTYLRDSFPSGHALTV